MNFEVIIGLEVHCELTTNSKMFSASPVSFAMPSNTMVNEVDLGCTGTLPVLNKAGVEYALRVCHALNMEIDDLVCFDRKNYYYSDLPKGYQITQDRRPIGKNGSIKVEVDQEIKVVEIERLHMEEDTAKQVHYDDYTLIDYNRAGIPLIEIVTKPCIRSGKQAAAYLEKLRSIFLYTGVSDAKLEEGSMRCDVNISLRPYGSEQFGVKTEIKNLNSISNVQKAIEFEVSRQEKILLMGGSIQQETRRYDETLKETVLMRLKGDAVDYKYYPEPNILPIRLDKHWIQQIKESLPEMPEQRIERYVGTYHLPLVDSKILVQTKEISDYFNEVVQYTDEYKLVSNWMLGEVMAYLNKNDMQIHEIAMPPQFLAKMINLIVDETISSKQAKKVFDILMKEGKDPEIIIEENHMKQISSDEEIRKIVCEILEANPQSIEDFKNGKDRAVGFLVGQIMKKTNGQANPTKTNKILMEELKSVIS